MPITVICDWCGNEIKHGRKLVSITVTPLTIMPDGRPKLVGDSSPKYYCDDEKRSGMTCAEHSQFDT